MAQKGGEEDAGDTARNAPNHLDATDADVEAGVRWGGGPVRGEGGAPWEEFEGFRQVAGGLEEGGQQQVFRRLLWDGIQDADAERRRAVRSGVRAVVQRAEVSGEGHGVRAVSVASAVVAEEGVLCDGKSERNVIFICISLFFSQSARKFGFIRESTLLGGCYGNGPKCTITLSLQITIYCVFL